MNESDMMGLAEMLIGEYLEILLIDPYYKVQIECTDAVKIADCVESGIPATWKLRLNPASHLDEIDVQMSALNAALSILFRDISPSNKLDEVRSKLTHALMNVLSVSADDPATTAED